MTTISHLHAELDRYPALLKDLADEFGSDGLSATAARIIDAERMDFHWEGRIAERFEGVLECFYGTCESVWRVAILGYFQGRYYTAICGVDKAQRVNWMVHLCVFESYAAALEDFTAGR